MELENKLRILADSAKYDVSCASSGSKRTGGADRLGSTASSGICHSFTPDGRCVSLLKILLTNYCVYDCLFCVNRASSDVPRARFRVDEVVRLTIDFYKRNYIEGLFLSSGIIQSPDYTMEQLVLVAKTLRGQHRFNGYIHLKVIPGASAELLRQAGLYADRVSANVELPTAEDLARLAPDKNATTIDGAMCELGTRITESKQERRHTRRAPVFAPAGQSTQLVVGATDTTDARILLTSEQLYRKHQLRRVYYSGFSPFQRADSRLPVQSPPLLREHRLYQADWLMRFYGFEAEEIIQPGANLDLERDPKFTWALSHREFFPVDVNTATREQLLRVPGVGYRNVKRILSIRRYHRLSLDDLRKLNVTLRRASPFIITADHNPAVVHLDSVDLRVRVPAAPQQLLLFESQSEAIGGEL